MHMSLAHDKNEPTRVVLAINKSKYETEDEEAPAPADVPAGISGRVSARRNGVTGEEVDEDDLEKLQAKVAKTKKVIAAAKATPT